MQMMPSNVETKNHKTIPRTINSKPINAFFLQQSRRGGHRGRPLAGSSDHMRRSLLGSLPERGLTFLFKLLRHELLALGGHEDGHLVLDLQSIGQLSQLLGGQRVGPALLELLLLDRRRDRVRMGVMRFASRASDLGPSLEHTGVDVRLRRDLARLALPPVHALDSIVLENKLST